MKLTKNQKIVLTILDDEPVKNSIDLVKRFTDLKESGIKRIINFLLKQELLEIITLPVEGWYFHTVKVTKEMIDKELAKRLDSSAYHRLWTQIERENPHTLKASEKLEQKVKRM